MSASQARRQQAEAVYGAALNQPVFLTTASVRARYGGVSRTWIARRRKTDGFPDPVKFGTSSTCLWRLSEIEAWEAAHAAAGKPVQS